MAQKHHLINVNWLTAFFVVTALHIANPTMTAGEAADGWEAAAVFLDEFRASHAIDSGFRDLSAFVRDDVVFEEVEEGDLQRLLSFLEVFGQEIGKYPPTYFAQGSLAKVVFVKKLFYEGQPAQGVYRFPESVMYFDIYRDFKNEGAQRHGIHHEFFHMVDVSLRRHLLAGGRDDLDIYGWAVLNDKTFKYEKIGRWHKGRNELNFFAPPKAGFATDYAFISMEEDMAEIYASLFIETENKLLQQWSQKDAILAAKIQKMREVLEKFCPEIDSQFWQDLF